MNEHERRARLIHWLEVIYDDVYDLILDNHIFWELQKIVDANPKFKEVPGLFTQWLASSFVQAAAVGVRRQAKVHDDSISLMRLLVEVQKYPTLVSRAHYMSLYADSLLRPLGAEDYDSVAGEGAPHLPAAVIEQQIKDFKLAVGGIEHYVDRRIAHYDKHGPMQPTPGFADLSEALRILEQLVILYWRLLKGIGMNTMLPMIAFDWHAIFRFAWVDTALGERIGSE